MKIFIGLGNPGRKYKNTRHNLGFWVIDRVAKEENIKINKSKYNSLIGEGRILNEKIYLVKPQTFMNLSGQAVKSIVSKMDADLGDLLVICDDVNLPQGDIRIKPSGSAGGHKGLKSIIQLLKSNQYPRLRIGVGKENIKEDLTSFVLKRISKKDRNILEDAAAKAKEACYIWLKEGIVGCMNRIN